MLFKGDRSGATSVVESVKIEGDYDVPGYVVAGGCTGRLRRLDPLPEPEPVRRQPDQQRARLPPSQPVRAETNALQCLACTALGEQTALAVARPLAGRPDEQVGDRPPSADPARRKGRRRTRWPPPRPRSPGRTTSSTSRRLCVAHNCDAALANLKFGGRYYLPAGVWQFSRPFTIPVRPPRSSATAPSRATEAAPSCATWARRSPATRRSGSAPAAATCPADGSSLCGSTRSAAQRRLRRPRERRHERKHDRGHRDRWLPRRPAARSTPRPSTRVRPQLLQDRALLSERRRPSAPGRGRTPDPADRAGNDPPRRDARRRVST